MDAHGKDEVFVGRIRRDETKQNIKLMDRSRQPSQRSLPMLFKLRVFTLNKD